MKVVYNIPIHFLGLYEGEKIILRSSDPLELVRVLKRREAAHLVGVQLLDLFADSEPLVDWGQGVPVELMMTNPQVEQAQLHHHSRLLDWHPVRVCIPVVPGFSQAVREAAVLNFPIKLEIGQPSPALIEELLAVLNFYLHYPAVSQPIEFFHSLLFSQIDRQPTSLWNIQEEDPAYIRYVTDNQIETIARSPHGAEVPDDLRSFLINFETSLLAEKGECFTCQFFANCGGYFKWPRKEYSCNSILLLFYDLQEAGAELRKNLFNYSHQRMEVMR